MRAAAHPNPPSLRYLAGWVLGLLLVVAVAACSFFAWQVHALLQLARESEERAAPALWLRRLRGRAGL